jgi:murein L,D-transpeptidase YafK
LNRIFQLFCLSSLFYAVGTRAQESFLPSNLLLMDNKFSHHVMVVEKQTHKLFLFENNGSFPKLVKTFSTVTGKFKGDKATEGDHKTPEGIYNFTEFLSKEELFKRSGAYAKIYGVGAFPMNYPNFIDEREGKKGNGIWIHSTDDDSRISKELDSRGCVVVQNQDLKELSQYIELNHTPIIVVQDMVYLAKETWERNRKDVSDAVNKWIKAWQEKDFETYIGAYDSQNFYDKTRGGFASYKAFKKAVFSRADKPVIKLDSMTILATNDYVVVYLFQDYQSPVINDTGIKTLYLKKNANYEWKIVGELWSKSEVKPPFTPANRYFKD